METPRDAKDLSILNPAPRLLPGPALLHELIQTCSCNGKPAIDYLDESGRRKSLSYDELHKLSDSLAAHIASELHKVGDAPEQLIIPLMIPQSPELYISILAILKIGGAFCPLNLDAPSERLKFIFDDVNAHVVLTTSTLEEKLPRRNESMRIISVDREAFGQIQNGKAGDGTRYSCRTPLESDLAYVMYTSGSTGTPKGVGIPHIAATQSLLAHDQHIPNFGRFLQFAAPTFDVSVFEIFFPLFRGQTLVCCDRTSMLTDLPGIIKSMDVDACELTPSVAGSLLRNRDSAPNLKLLLTIGEMLTAPVVSEFGGDLQQPSMLWGMYGPTEAAIHCTVQPAFTKSTTPRCIGIPFDTVSAFVIRIPEEGNDASKFEILPQGEVGELAIGGYQLATEYLNRPEQNAKAFIDTEFGRVYKTGDKAKILEDGTIECLGRVGEGQIKLNGQRMELGEIEHAILRAPGCHSAFVCVLSNILVAFAAVESLSVTRDDIITSCNAWLPPAMVPSECIVMEAFPRLASGKIDRMKLKQTYLDSQVDDTTDNDVVAEPLVRVMCDIADEVLQTQTKPLSRLASIGVDSLSAIQYARNLRNHGIPVNTTDVLQAETILDLYQLVQPRVANQDKQVAAEKFLPHHMDLMEILQRDSADDVQWQDVEAVIPCTALQTSMIAETLRDHRLYINTIQIRLPSGVDYAVIESWFVELSRRNEILRTGFIQSSRGLVQVVWKNIFEGQISSTSEGSLSEPLDVEKFLRQPFKVDISAGGGVAIITIHHSLYDGWTMDLFLDDLTLLSQEKEVPERPQFRAISQYLDTELFENDLLTAKEFWADHLRGSPGSTIPNFKTIPVAKPEVLEIRREISVSPVQIRKLALESGFSPQALFQGCLCWLWGAITAAEDVTFGSVFSGRTLPINDLERVMGPCLSTLPIRSILGESETILDLVRNLHQTTRNIMRLKPLGLSEIKKVADLSSGSRLFDVLFVYQESLASRNRGDDSVREISHHDALETKLLLEVEPLEHKFQCQWTWHSDVFSQDQVDVFAHHLDFLVGHFSRNMQQPIASIQRNFLSSGLSMYNSAFKSLEIHSSLAELVEETASKFADREALQFATSTQISATEPESLTYRQLNQRANRIARYLQSSGASQGGIVAIIMEKSPLLYCTILGILKAGCSYLPLLPSTPKKRVQLIMSQAQPSLCVLDGTTDWADDPLSCPVVTLQDVRLDDYDDSDLKLEQAPSQLAYIIFTSGTTGTPKGVSVTNKNMLSNIKALARIYPHSPTSRMLQACSQAFDVSVFEIFFAWGTGMCLCAATNDTLFEDLEQSIRYFGVTHLSMTVTVASLVNPKNVPEVKFLVTSGEPMTAEVLESWADFLWQGYGPSETTNICTVRKVAPGDSPQYLGWSFENTSSFVFYPNSYDLVPMCGLGELCFGGDQVAEGYLNMPETTAAKFFEHPQFGRLYRSGDLGRMLPDGSLVISGRLDSQIKIRGQRIELREIYSLVLGSGIAKACAAILLNRQDTVSHQLALFYVPNTEESQKFELLTLAPPIKHEVHTLIQILQGALPAYMVPSFIIPIASLPRTSSGKIDNESMRQSTALLSNEQLNQYSFTADVDTEFTELTDVELRIAHALAETLEISASSISRWTSFATLGLDSISAMPLARKLQIEFQRRITLSQVLQNPSIGRLAQSIGADGDTQKVTSVQSSLLPDELTEAIRQRFVAQGRPVETILPCTPLQVAMLASSAASKATSTYCNQVILRIKKHRDTMVGYWDGMCRRHGILRTCFVTTDDPQHPLIQVILETPCHNWSHFEALDLAQSAAAHLRSFPAAIDTSVPPLALATIHDPNGIDYISFICHHALYDGVAMDRLFTEIEALALQQELLPLTCSFEQFLREGPMASPPNEDEFWKSVFDGFQPLTFQRDESNANGVTELPIPSACQVESSLSKIDTRLRELGVSLLALCQAAWSQTLSSVLKTPDICFGNVVSGRSISLDGIDCLVAPCFNTIPVRVKINASMSNRDLMRSCQQLNATMLQYQFTSLRKIQSHVSVTNNHLFDSLMLLQPPRGSLNDDIWSLEQDSGTMDVPIVCEVIPFPDHDKLEVFIHRDNEFFSAEAAELMKELFIQALGICLQYPSSQASLTAKLPSKLQSALEKTKLPRVNKAHSENSTVALVDETWTEHELQTRAIVAKIANCPEHKIGKDISIHRLGLDSISAVQIAHLLRVMDFHISPADILANPTCAGIASHMSNATPHQEAFQHSYDLTLFDQSMQCQASILDLKSKPDAILPCTPLQQGMISQFLLSEGKSYFNFVSWTLETNTDCQALQTAWENLSAQHQILRTGFVPVSHDDTSFAMIVYNVENFTLPVTKIEAATADHFDTDVWRRDCSQRARNDISHPPWSVVLIDKPEAKSMHLGIHHALYDAFSLRGLINRLLANFYGQEVSPEIPISSAVSEVFSEMEHQRVGAEAFWKGKANEMVVNSFPLMTSLREDVNQTISITQSSTNCAQDLREFAAKAGVTVQAALQSAWARLLSSYHGESAVTFGVVLSGRTVDDSSEALFPRITTLPVIASNHESNRVLLQSMMDYNVSLRRYGSAALNQIHKWVGRPDSSIFDTILVLQQSDYHDACSQSWRISDEVATIDYPISLEIEEPGPGPLRFSLVFQSSRMNSEQANWLLKQFDALVAHLLDSPDGNTDDLVGKSPDLFSILPAEHDELPTEAVLLHDMVERTAKNLPDNLALEFVDELAESIQARRWSYRELDENGNKTAHFLASKGVEPRSIVAILFDKSPEAYFAILGILKAGCAFVALDPNAPTSRQEFILKDSEAVALMVKGGAISELALKPSIPVLEVHLHELDSYLSTPLLSHRVTAADVCYCLYTSGTTGTPKGCLITHENTVQAMLAFECLFSGHWDADSRWLQFASFHFDVSVLEQYWSWLVGIAVISAPRDLILSDLVATISRLEITHIDLTPSLARLVHPDEVPSLCKGVFITGGEQLRQDILDVWGSKRVIYNAYGPTEATIGVTMYQRVPQNGRSSNIGKQFPNVGSYVLRPGSDVPVLRGGVGELCVSGKLVGKGYLNRPELTEERFPTLQGYGERVYRTGDLVRVLHDGCFDFLGRADDQVKLRGQRLEIGEVNHAIKTGITQVVDVATLVTKHRDQDRDIMVSFIVSDILNDRSVQLEVLSDSQSLMICRDAQDACRSKLPGYMVPTYVLGVPYIPLSANNKAQTSILKQLFNDTSPEQLRTLSSASSDENEHLLNLEPQLAAVLATIVNSQPEKLLASSTIFELGIDSISVIGLARSLRGLGYSSISPSTILQHPRLGALAKLMQQEPETPEDNQALRVKQAMQACHHRHLSTVCNAFSVTQPDIEYIAPCTPLQEGMLARVATADGRATYFNTFEFELNPQVSVDRIRAAWEDVIRRNSVLRTCFLETADGYVQVAFKDTEFRWLELDADSSDISELLDQRYLDWIKSNETVLANPLELDYIRLNDAGKLVLRIFHGIYDAQSFDLIIRQVKGRYQNLELPTGPDFIDILPHGPLCDYQSSKPFWMERFNKFDRLSSLRIESSSKRTSQSDSHDRVDSRVYDIGSLESRRVELGVTQQTIVQAVWLAVLKQNFSSWPSLGVIYSGRSLLVDGIDATIGPLFNTLPFCVQNPAVDSWKSLVQDVHGFNAAVLSFVHVPLRQIQKWCSGGQPLFETLFAFDREYATNSNEDNGLWQEIRSSSNADYPLAFEGVVTKDNKLKVTLVSMPTVADDADLSKLLDDFQRALDGVQANTDFPATGNDGTQAMQTNSATLPTHPMKSTSSGQYFQWTEQAVRIRAEVAALAAVPTEDIGADTTLFELGLDSIDVIKLVARLRRIGIELTTSSLMKHPTIRDILSSHIPQTLLNGTSASPEQLLENESARLKEYLTNSNQSVADDADVLPVTPLQDAMVAEMILSDFRRYFNHDVLELSPEIDFQRFKAGIQLVVDNSPILRTTFVEIDDPNVNEAYCAIVNRNINPFQPEVSIQTLDDLGAITESARLKAMNANGRSYLLQITPVHMQQRNFILLSISHALYDGASLSLFHQDVQAAYEGRFTPHPPYQTSLARIMMNTSETAEQFWSDFLHDANPTTLPPIDGLGNDTVAALHRFETVSQVDLPRIKSFCMNHRITIQALGQASWGVVLASFAKSLNVTFGVVVSGRSSEEEQALMFPTMNTVPVSMVLYGTVSEFIQYVWINMTKIGEFQHFPLRKAQRLARPGGGSLFNTLFTMQTSPQSGHESGEPVWKSVKSDSEVEYPICVEMEIVDNHLIWRAACSESHIAKEDGESLLVQLDHALKYLTDNEDRQVIESRSTPNSVSICGLPSFNLASEDQSSGENSTDGTRTTTTTTTPSIFEVSENEKAVMEILAEVSGVDRNSIAPYQSIYHLGLDSISAIKISSMLRKRGIVISVRDMVKSASIRDIVSKAGSSIANEVYRHDISEEEADVLQSIDIPAMVKKTGQDVTVVETVLPALPMQVHMLSVWGNTTGELFFYTFNYEMVGSVTRGAVETAWHKLVDELPILRTVFVATESEQIPFIQIVMRAGQHHPESLDSGRGTESWKFESRSTPFVSLQVEKVSGKAPRMAFKIHHALYDGVSLPIIINRLKELCGDDTSIRDVNWTSWKKFVLRQYARDVRAQKQEFWQRYLQGAQRLQLSPNNPDGSPRTSQFSPAALGDTFALRSAATTHGVGLQAVFFAACAKFLSKSVQEPPIEGPLDVLMGIYLANRVSGEEDLANVPLPTLSIVPLRVRFQPDEGVVEIAKRIQKDLVDISSFENASASLWEIEEWTGVKVDTFLNFLSLPDEPASTAEGSTGVEIRQITAPEAKTNDQEIAASSIEEGYARPTDRWMSSNLVKNNYIDGLDIEAALRGNSLDIGVFGKACRLSQHEALELIDYIVAFLETVN
ncbi:amino acid adenylation domain-containing protein [Xylariales sp. PMI_506]|nr:amino acid adenylation domain-containing protein [Xylariales sp. PMI_506]